VVIANQRGRRGCEPSTQARGSRLRGKNVALSSRRPRLEPAAHSSCRSQPGRTRDLPGPDLLPDRAQGVGGGHRARVVRSTTTGRSLLVTGAITDSDVRICAPEDLWPDKGGQDIAREHAEELGARTTLTADPAEGLAGADFVHTDVWVSMGEPRDVWAVRVKDLTPYQVNAKAMASTGTPTARFMHCLPAFHDTRTTVGQEGPSTPASRWAGGYRRGVSPRRRTSLSTRPRTGYTPSRRSWSRPSAHDNPTTRWRAR
jgi:hypothetical protein